MKVVQLGNMANVAYFLSYGLKRCDVDSVVFDKAYKKGTLDYELYYCYGQGNPLGVEFRKIESGLFEKQFGGPSERCEYLRWLSDEIKDADIVHMHNGGTITNFFACKLKNKKIVRHFHGSDLRQAPVWRNLFIFLTNTKLNLVSTPDLLDYKKDAIWLPNPVNPMFFKKMAATEERNYIFTFTRFEEQTKKISAIFKAWEKIREEDGEVLLKVVKWGADFNRFYERYKGDKRIEWLPLLNRRRLLNEIRKSRIVISQQGFRAFGLTELETMALGKPLISNVNVTCHPAYYRPPALFAGNADELADAALALLSDPKRRKRVGAQGAFFVKKYHEPVTVAKKLIELYEQRL